MFFNNENFKTRLIALQLFVLISLCNGKEIISKSQVNQVKNFQSVTSTAAAVKLSAANAINVSAPKDGLNKRNIKGNDLSTSHNVAARTYDPPQEFYRGPGSVASSNTVGSSNAYIGLNNAASDYTTKPITFPDTMERGKYTDSSSGSYTSKEYNKRQLQRGTTQGYGDSEDRISVGHFGSADHSTTHGGSSASYLHGSGISAGYGHGAYGVSGGYGVGSSYDAGRPYYHDYDGRPRFPVATGHGGAGNSYYIGSHSDEAGGIPFDVYGLKGHYAGNGGEYSYSTYPDEHENVAHKGHGYGGDWQHKALLAKSFLIPLASAAVLGIAAAFVSNPLLLQLGTVSGPTLVGKRRKRRDLSPTTVGSLTKQQSTGQSLAYRNAHRQHRRLTRV